MTSPFSKDIVRRRILKLIKPSGRGVIISQRSHLFGPHVAEPPLVQTRVSAVEIRRDGVLQEGVADGLQSLEVDGVVGVGHGEGLQDKGR